MGLPVIAGVLIENIGLHAITLTGYSLKEDIFLRQEGNKCIPFTGLRIDKFYVHDDQIGPFSKLEIEAIEINIQKEKYDRNLIKFKSSWTHPEKEEKLLFYPIVLIIPVYSKIRLTFLDCQDWLTRFDETISQLFTNSSDLNREWNLTLTTTNQYKKDIKKNNIDNEVLRSLLLKQHPRFIWRAKLTINNIEVLEFLFDATEINHSFPIYQIIWYSEEFKQLVKDSFGNQDLRKDLINCLTQKFLDAILNS